MEIEFQLSKKDYFEAAKLYLRDSLQKRSWVFILLTVLFIFPLAGENKEWWRLLFALIAAPLMVLGLLYFIPLWISFIRLNKILSKDKSGLEKRKLTVTENGLLTESENSTTMRNWESIVSAHSNDKFIYLIRTDKKFSPIPKRAFPSESEAINFLGLVQSKIIKIRGMLIFPNSSTTNKPSYSLGLLCLIPLVGAIAGVVFIINGIFKYKDKWFIVIGAGGILFTVSIYATMFYNFQYGTDTRVGFSNLSQVEVNTLMKSVEFYKLEYGVYPDSLGQIRNNDHTAEIDDPLQLLKSGNSKLTTRFIYQKVGNHYYLFSSGIDGIPNTKDDIYPQVTRSDSAKFGLIRH